ncbi:MAG TPA: adenosylcobinamide-GDP ribazoletransferase [Vicinamibacteria bacterium]|nr:adenosylcobinamide-GDP ribazoletransferase [Vicinamibacteria bacterium]
MTRLLAAFAFLTRIPIPRHFDDEDVGRSTVFFPLVGAAIGSVLLLLWTLAPFPPLLTAALAVTLSAWLTRAMHLDGLADFADGLAGGRTREDVLEIMKDPRVGAFGAVAVALLLAVKVAAIESLPDARALIVAPALARWASVPVSMGLPYARRDGIGLALSVHVGSVELIGATLSCVCLSLVAPPRFVLYSAGAVVLASFFVLAIAWRRLGGITGDVLGANTELAETAALVAAVGWTSSPSPC